MKPLENLKLVAIAAFCLTLATSCTEDSLLGENAQPQHAESISLDASAQVIQFISWQQLEIQQPPCPLEHSTLGGEGSDENVRSEQCFGNYGFSGAGQGYIEGLDRFLVRSLLNFQPQPYEVTGRIQFDFPGTGDILVLQASGEPQRITTGDGSAILVPVSYFDGTGSFDQADFDGMLTINDADKIFDADRADYHATILIDGSLVMQ